MIHTHINIALDLMRKLDEKLDHVQRALCACSQSVVADPVLPNVDDKGDSDLSFDEFDLVFEDLVTSDSDTVDECVQSLCDDQTHTQVLLPDSTSDLNDGTLEEVSGIYACKAFAEIPDREIDMEIADSVKIDIVKHETQVSDKMLHTISRVKCNSSNLFKFDKMLLALPCMLSACGPSRCIFDHFGTIDHAAAILRLHQVCPKQFELDFPFDPGSSLFTTFFEAMRNCVYWGALGSCNPSRFMTLTMWNSCIAPFELQLRNTNSVGALSLLAVVDDGRHFATSFIVCSFDMLLKLAECHGYNLKYLVSQRNLVGKGVSLHVWDPGIHRRPTKLHHSNNDILFHTQIAVHIVVHQEFYGVSNVHNLVSWFYPACQTPEIEKDCCLYSAPCGILTATAIAFFWACVTCIRSQLEVAYHNANMIEPALGILSTPSNNCLKVCVICKHLQGSGNLCSKCASNFHVLYALQDRYHMGLVKFGTSLYMFVHHGWLNHNRKYFSALTKNEMVATLSLEFLPVRVGVNPMFDTAFVKWLLLYSLQRIVLKVNEERILAEVAPKTNSSLNKFAAIIPMLLYSNLEDKVLFEDGSIVMNQNNFVRACRIEVVNETDSVGIIVPSKMMESFIWDPGPINRWFKRTNS